MFGIGAAVKTQEDSLPPKLQELCESLLAGEKTKSIYNLLDKENMWSGEAISTLLADLGRKVNKMLILVPPIIARGRTNKTEVEKAYRLNLLAKNVLDAAITLPSQLISAQGKPVIALLFNTQKEFNTVLFINADSQQAGQKHESLIDVQITKIFGAYRRARTKAQPKSNASSPVCYADQFDDAKLGVLIDNYAYLAGPVELARNKCSVDPAVYIK